MTTEIAFRHLSRQDLSPSAKIVLIALERCPGLNTDALSTITGLSRATCYRAVKQLRERDAVPVIRPAKAEAAIYA
jgi:hypothetical protein